LLAITTFAVGISIARGLNVDSAKGPFDGHVLLAVTVFDC
jgi:hypothetical protein